MGKLTARKVGTVKAGAKAAKYGDGDGLQLVVAPTGAKKWVLRVMVAGKAIERGLGAYPDVGLADARAKASEARERLKGGEDLVRAEKRAVPTFGKMAQEYIAEHCKDMTAKQRLSWRSTIATYCGSLLDKPVDTIVPADVLAALTPIWSTKPRTANDLRARIERILNAAQSHGHIDETRPNPARLRGHLENLLSRRKPSGRHHEAMAFADVPAFVARLREAGDIKAMALEFIILTGARLSEALEARWSEIDLDAKLWTISAARMKARREHKVPLSDRACQILEVMTAKRVSDFVFPGAIPNRPICGVTIGSARRRAGAGEAKQHGFRSSFRDWAGDVADVDREIAEAALAHAVGSATERAYRRGTALDRRRVLMQQWADYISGVAQETNVIDIASRRA